MNFIISCLPIVSIVITIFMPSEALMFNIAIPVSIVLLAVMAIVSGKSQSNSGSKQTIYNMTALSQLLLIAIQVGGSVNAVVWTEGEYAAVLVGLVMIVLGNYMPRTKPNAAFGLRLPWTISNEIVWRKSNRFAGFILVIVGVLVVLLSILFNEHAETILLIGVGVSVIVASAVSFLYHKNEYRQSNV